MLTRDELIERTMIGCIGASIGLVAGIWKSGLLSMDGALSITGAALGTAGAVLGSAWLHGRNQRVDRASERFIIRQSILPLRRALAEAHLLLLQRKTDNLFMLLVRIGSTADISRQLLADARERSKAITVIEREVVRRLIEEIDDIIAEPTLKPETLAVGTNLTDLIEKLAAHIDTIEGMTQTIPDAN